MKYFKNKFNEYKNNKLKMFYDGVVVLSVLYLFFLINSLGMNLISEMICSIYMFVLVVGSYEINKRTNGGKVSFLTFFFHNICQVIFTGSAIVFPESILSITVSHLVWFGTVSIIGWLDWKNYKIETDIETYRKIPWKITFNDETNDVIEKISLLTGKTEAEVIFLLIETGAWCYNRIDSEKTIASVDRKFGIVDEYLPQ